MANNKVTVSLGIEADVSKFKQEIADLQNRLSKLSVSKDFGNEATQTFNALQKELLNLESIAKKGNVNIVDLRSAESNLKKIETQLNNFKSKYEKQSINFLSVDKTAVDELQKRLDFVSNEYKAINGELTKQLNIVNKINTSIADSNSKIATYDQTIQKLNTDLQNEQNAHKAIKISRDAAAKEEKQALKDVNAAQKAYDDQLKVIEQIIEAYKQTHNGKSTGFNLTSEYKKANKELVTLKQNLDNALNAHAGKNQTLEDLKKQFEDGTLKIRDLRKQITALGNTKTKETNNVTKLNTDLATAQTELTNAQQKMDAFNQKLEHMISLLSQSSSVKWSDYGIDLSTIKSYTDLENALNSLDQIAKNKLAKELPEIANLFNLVGQGSTDMGRKIGSANSSIDQLTEKQKDINRLKDSFLRFFSITNQVMLFRRAVNSAVSTIKELDAVMTETAVVTNYTVADMWNQLGDYTARANELGVSIKSAYESATIYYQQGLNTNQVMAVSTETLKMARIASLDAAEATDRMTNALRGFNMEINQTNAQRVSDVYSKLAAISASNVDEISTAMTKVASLASSANMEFETTAAFLAQMIETTRESAETAGTALKTVVARFSEVKNLYSKNELEGTDEDGEVIDVNKVSKALRTAGIDLNKYFTEQVGLDDIFMELASKWNDLEDVQQRYIATQAAGSRRRDCCPLLSAA